MFLSESKLGYSLLLEYIATLIAVIYCYGFCYSLMLQYVVTFIVMKY